MLSVLFSKRFCFLVVTVMFCVMMFCVLFGSEVLATDYQDIVDEITNNRKSSLYNLELNAPFTKDTSGLREDINPETGILSINYELFNLPGRGGVDCFEMSLSYCTSYAAYEEESVVYDESKEKYVNSVEEKSDFIRAIENFGIGWRIHLPYIEKQDGKRNKTYIYVHLVNGSVYRHDDSDVGLEDYELTDVQFIKKSEMRNGIETTFQLHYVNGDSYYFNSDGYPVEKTDKLGNHVFYNWSNDKIPLLLSVSDDSSDVVTFEYNDELVNVRHKDKVYKIYREEADDGWLICAIADPLGRITEFEYEEINLSFDFWGKLGNGKEHNVYYLINSVEYPNGLRSVYEYTISSKWLYEKENGMIEYAKILKRYDTDGVDAVSSLTYKYDYEPDGSPSHKSDDLPGDYTYTTNITDEYGGKTTYVYNHEHNQVRLIKSTEDKLLSEEIRHFDSISNMPDMFVNTVYNDAGDERSVYNVSKFDNRGNLIYLDTYENPECAGQNVKEYEYSQVANLCVYESSLKDENTKIEIKRTVGPGGGIITGESTYENGRLVKSDGFSYDAYNNLIESCIQTSETDVLVTKYNYSSEYSFQYPVNMTVSGIKNADGELDSYTYRYEYDKYGNVTQILNPDNSKVSYSYDKLDRKLAETLEDGSTRQVVYDDKKNTVLTTDAVGYSLLYSYDKYGKIISVYDDVQQCYLIRRKYDLKERLIEETDARGTRYCYTYDELDRCCSIVAYDDKGNILQEQYLNYDVAVFENGKGYTRLTLEQGASSERRETIYLFDYLERQTQETQRSGDKERSQYFTYDIAGNCIAFTDINGAVTRYEYDVFGNPIYTVLPDGVENHFTYDFNGNILSEVNGMGEEKIYTYDGLSRLIRQETVGSSGKSVWRKYYDFRNNVLVELDAENNRTEYGYDLRGFLSAVRQYSNGRDGQETEYTYDREGRIVTMATGGIGSQSKHTYTYTLDVLGRVVKETDPMGGVSQYAYEADGNISESIDRNGIITSYTYDGLGRVINQANSKSGNLSYTYNDFGQPVSVTDGILTVCNKYNNFGELESVARDKSREYYTYDLFGRLITRTVTDKDMGSVKTSYSYDILNRPVIIETDVGKELLTYDRAGRIAEKSYPSNGITKKYAYYADGTLKSQLTYLNGELVSTEGMDYDKNGNKIVWDRDGEITNYAYDGMQRLKSVENPDDTLVEYEFDGFGNIERIYTLTPSGIKTQKYEYDHNNRLLLTYDDNSSTRYEYDKAGNLSKKTFELAGYETHNWYSYDGFNRLVSFVSEDTTAFYTYNPEGLRESKTVNGNPTRYLYSGADIVGELKSDNYYLYHRGTELIGSTSFSGNRTIYKLDTHGSVSALLAPDGKEIKSYTYDAYGNETSSSVTPDNSNIVLYLWENNSETSAYNPFRYCGEYYDNESGLIYLRNRYYDPSIGRFISEDPIRDGLNWYVYCAGNPVMFVDPWGESPRVSFDAYMTVISQGVGEPAAFSSIQLALKATKRAEKYAKEHGFIDSRGKPKDDSNEADAYRHFSWNYEMASIIGYDKALKCSTSQEISFLRIQNWVVYAENGNENDRKAFMPLTTLMDVWNNTKGVNAYASNDYNTYDDAFKHLKDNEQLILDPNDVPKYYDFDKNLIVVKQFGDNEPIWGYNVVFDYTNGYITNIRLQ